MLCHRAAHELLTLCKVRGALSNQTQFSTQDCGKYNVSHLFDTIVELFEHPSLAFAQKTLRWWNKRVFGRTENLWQITAAGGMMKRQQPTGCVLPGVPREKHAGC
ncbi:hypothetical protein C8Q73DRAFT_667140 [Cubamyces lactineus]|nr:hypothetical protein C8Q73DRAFT_667140 [Cubamyces lactineus]